MASTRSSPVARDATLPAVTWAVGPARAAQSGRRDGHGSGHAGRAGRRRWAPGPTPKWPTRARPAPRGRARRRPGPSATPGCRRSTPCRWRWRRRRSRPTNTPRPPSVSCPASAATARPPAGGQRLGQGDGEHVVAHLGPRAGHDHEPGAGQRDRRPGRRAGRGVGRRRPRRLGRRLVGEEAGRHHGRQRAGLGDQPGQRLLAHRVGGGVDAGGRAVVAAGAAAAGRRGGRGGGGRRPRAAARARTSASLSSRILDVTQTVPWTDAPAVDQRLAQGVHRLAVDAGDGDDQHGHARELVAQRRGSSDWSAKSCPSWTCSASRRFSSRVRLTSLLHPVEVVVEGVDGDPVDDGGPHHDAHPQGQEDGHQRDDVVAEVDHEPARPITACPPGLLEAEPQRLDEDVQGLGHGHHHEHGEQGGRHQEGQVAGADPALVEPAHALGVDQDGPHLQPHEEGGRHPRPALVEELHHRGVGADGHDQLGPLLVGEEHGHVLAGAGRLEGGVGQAQLLEPGRPGRVAAAEGVHDQLGAAPEGLGRTPSRSRR